MPKEPREFQAELLDWDEIHELPEGWPHARLTSLLQSLDIDDVSENDAADMALMALQDREPDEAAELVLHAVFGDSMRPGVRQNLAPDLTEERPWEEFASIAQQAGIFDAVVLLQKAFPRSYDKPDAVSISLGLSTSSERGNAWLDAPVPDPALLLRILAAGMDERAVLRRLFADSLAGTSFPEASGILWRVDRRSTAATDREFTLISSHQWFDALKHAGSWVARAWVDGREQTEE